MTWQDQGACRGVNADQFFPSGKDERRTAAAKAICADCPVRGTCLAHALARPEKHGIWGGYTDDERQAMQSNGVVARRLAVVS